MKEELVSQMKMAREKAGLNQKDVGDKLGLTDKTVSSWERGRSEPSIDEFVAYCQIVGADYVELLRAAYGDPTSETQTVDLTADEAELVRKYRSLDSKAQRRIMRAVNGEYEDAMNDSAEESSIGAGTG